MDFIKIIGITYYNFEDRVSKRINKGVNVHTVKQVNDKMGVGYQSEPIRYPIETFNSHFGTTLPVDDKAQLDSSQIASLGKLLERQIKVLYDANKRPEVTQFPK